MSDTELPPAILTIPVFEEMDEVVDHYSINTSSERVVFRPDVSIEEQQQWIEEDPDYPPEHYRCVITFQDRTLELYQTVGADYPGEDEEAQDEDLYAWPREVLLSPAALLESAALKANSVDEAACFDDWVAKARYETATPVGTYNSFNTVREGLLDLLGVELYDVVVRLAVEAELDEDEESEI